ncbi:helix-turn-helix domain-containing protein [Nocardioides sp. NPDC101246]|uniref:helix-turn-helix domain-containing protein n=1 Tax=Nocardioides sp. NPDC101246 TaxID=3364336 RepID=UPI0037FC5298
MTNEPAPSRVERGARIDLQMRLAKMSQRDLAEATGFSRATVKKAVDGDPSAQESKLLAIEEYLNDLLKDVGIDPDEPEQGSAADEPVVFQMVEPDGTTFTISGAPDQADMMREQIMKIIEDRKGKRA